MNKILLTCFVVFCFAGAAQVHSFWGPQSDFGACETERDCHSSHCICDKMDPRMSGGKCRCMMADCPDCNPARRAAIKPCQTPTDCAGQGCPYGAQCYHNDEDTEGHCACKLPF